MKHQHSSRHEVIKAFEKFGLFSKDRSISCISSSEVVDKLNYFFKNGILSSYERPDAYIKVENEILIIEHFSIDSFGRFSNNGSKYQAKDSEINRIVSDILQESKVIRNKIGLKNSYADLIDNIERSFIEHYENIPEYKERLKSITDKDTKFTVCFLIEDMSPLGNLFACEKGIIPFYLYRSREFLEFFQNKKDVDWVLSASIAYGIDYDKPYLLSQNDIEVCLNDYCLDYDSYQFLTNESTVVEDYLFELENDYE